ncbi:class I SAM-dependent methyltransferase [Catalinimonas niigatensis]|uniref:class I SAM-dependent methyltransferase n=1 Tax=Catalinimonas niigatensis TaxID=1397264 RepID=UPI0026655DF3|nr:class I SAM-dependent methyltransferase [Catalinimonas niigatensis]WPP52755.1 class I SAM-dependent methyltransferase [Catalinimonas niigatensis]
MKINFSIPIINTFFIGLLLISQLSCAQVRKEDSAAISTTDSIYSFAEPSSTDGTGKFYMGRDIAQVMGHRGAAWLERDNRKEEERTDLLIKALELEKDDVIADIGAGTGYFTFRISELLPQGRVLAVDIQPEMLDMIRAKMNSDRITNVSPVLGNIDDSALPEDSVDLVLMVDAYHEFSHPREMMKSIVASLAPGGRVILAEYRAEDPEIMIKPRHKMTEAQAVKEMEAVGLVLYENKDILPQQHLMFFKKK